MEGDRTTEKPVLFPLKLAKFWGMLWTPVSLNTLRFKEENPPKKQTWKKRGLNCHSFTIYPGNSSMSLQVASYPIRNFIFLSESRNTNCSSAVGLPRLGSAGTDVPSMCSKTACSNHCFFSQRDQRLRWSFQSFTRLCGASAKLNPLTLPFLPSLFLSML